MTSAKPEGRVDAAADDDRRQLAAKLVNALYRVIKACQIHAEHNQAVTQVIEQAVQSTAKFCERSGVKSVAILFTPHAVFINRQMLRASKETYQLALELGTLLLACDATELTLGHDVSAGEVAEFGRAAANASRDGKPSIKLRNGGWDGLRLRKVQGLGASANVAPTTKAARTFAAALMILKSFYGELRVGNYEPRQGVKRIAQKLVSASELEARLLLSIAAVPSVDPDRTQTLLATAIVSLAMANQLATDRSLLSAIVTAALLHDVGRPRVLGHDAGLARTLNADEEALQASSSVVAITALGKLHPPNLTRAVLVHETHALKSGVAPYRAKRTPLLASRIIVLARTFVELRTPTPTSGALSLDDAVQVLDGQASDNTGRALIKLLVGALGLFPAGTMVELSTGEMGVVLATPTLPVDFARPPVRILYDHTAQLLPEPLDIDLATEPGRTIRKAIDSTDQQMRQMRAYVMQLSSKRARRSAEEPAPSFTRDSVPSDHSSHTGSMRGSASSSRSSGSSSGISSGSASGGSSGAALGGSSSISSAGSSSGRSNPASSRGDSQISRGDSQISRGDSSISRGDSSISSAGISISERREPRKLSTMRWDPREEEASSGAPAQGSDSARGALEPPKEHQATRSVSWGELNRELEASIEESKSSPGAGAESETDSILAAYLADDAGGRPSSQGDQSRSWGLRWTNSGKSNAFDQLPSSAGHSNAMPPTASSSAGRSSPGASLPDSRGGEDAWDEIFAPPPPLQSKPPPVEPKRAPPPMLAKPPAALAPADRATPQARPMLREAVTPPVPIRAVQAPIRSEPSRPVEPQRSVAPPVRSIEPPPIREIEPPPIREIEPPPSSGAPLSQSPPRSARTVSASSWAAPPKSKRVDVAVINVPEPAAEAPPPPSDEAPASASDAVADSAKERRAKAGSAAWGNAKKDGKK